MQIYHNRISGAYLASPYLRQRDNGLWEAGVAHFIFPSENEINSAEQPVSKAYDPEFGDGATNMFTSFFECFREALNDAKLPMRYLGIDVCPRSHLKSLAMNFMVLDTQIICLRSNLREREDVAWTILSSAGVRKVYHMPALPMTIQATDLKKAKGLM